MISSQWYHRDPVAQLDPVVATGNYQWPGSRMGYRKVNQGALDHPMAREVGDKQQTLLQGIAKVLYAQAHLTWLDFPVGLL